jgi:hypothetical protein
MAAINAVEAERLAQLWAIMPTQRELINVLLSQYVEMAVDSDEERAYLVGIVALFTSANELSAEYAEKLRDAQGVG